MAPTQRDVATINNRSLVDQVYEYLLQRIIEGELKYGETISTKDIAEELHVSTMPVREAIKRLKYEQIVDIKPQSKCLIKEPSKKMIAEVYEIRQVLEIFAVSKGIKNPDKNILSRLHSIVSKMKKLATEKNPEEEEHRAIALDRQFHEEICKLANNDYLNYLYSQLSVHVNVSLIHSKTYHKLRDQKRYQESHTEILDCLTSHPKDAVEALTKHFKDVNDLLFNAEEPFSDRTKDV